MNVYLVARKSCSDAAMTFWKEANISGLNLNQSSWADRLPMMCSWSIVRGGRKCLSNSECFGAFWRACSTVELENKPTWIDSTEVETVHSGRIHLRKLQQHGSPFHLEG